MSFSYELPVVCVWSAASLGAIGWTLAGRLPPLAADSRAALKSTPLRHKIFPYCQLLVLILLVVALAIDNWAVFLLHHDSPTSLDRPTETVRLGAVNRRSSYKDQTRVKYYCVDAEEPIDPESSAAAIAAAAAAAAAAADPEQDSAPTVAAASESSGEWAQPLADKGRCQTVKASGALLLIWGLFAACASLALLVCVWWSLRGSAASQPVRQRLAVAIPRLCVMQLLCILAALVVWFMGMVEPLLVAQGELNGLTGPVPGTSFVLGVFAAVAALPASLFYADKGAALGAAKAAAPATRTACQLQENSADNAPTPSESALEAGIPHTKQAVPIAAVLANRPPVIATVPHRGLPSGAESV